MGEKGERACQGQNAFHLLFNENVQTVGTVEPVYKYVISGY